MFGASSLQPSSLDVPTLSFVAVCLAGLLGLFLIFTWLQQRHVRALAWWGSAYLIGASSMALWAEALAHHVPLELPEALAFLACGVIWNGVRLFRGRRLRPVAASAGAVAWLILCQLPALSQGSNGRISLAALMVAAYTFIIAFELWRERRKSLYSRTAAVVVPCLHAGIFLMPLGMQAFLPAAFAAGWPKVFVLEAMIYAVGTAFIVLLMVKDHHVHVYRSAASTDHLTGLLNRRAFMNNALSLCVREGDRGEPVTLMMFDLDHFKTINDRFGHAVGDEALRVFAHVVRTSMRATDIVGRLGGEEFAAIVPGNMEMTAKIAERIRAGFEVAGAAFGTHAIGATVSIGTATAYGPVTDIDALIIRADGALYRAKHGGRNRVEVAEDEPASESVLRPNTDTSQAAKVGRLSQRQSAARRPKTAPALSC
jgi:diguanylate cyclase (GGDEF)-like protein